MVSKDAKNGSHSAGKSDDFLAQVLETETRAEELVQKADQKRSKDLEKITAALKDERAAALLKAKDAAKIELEKATVSAKMNYENMVKEAHNEADSLLDSKGGMLSGLQKDAHDFFLQKL